ncbi:hypothetical protein ACFX10_002980 [Malus domestica]
MDEMGEILGMPIVDNPSTYLGLPTIWGTSKCQALGYIKDRLLRKIQGWKHKLLSHAGKEVMIKVVAQAVLVYPMNIFKFPAHFCKELDYLIASFWWGQNNEDKRIH